MQLVWNKPVITFYKERFGKQEKEPFVAVKARKFKVSKQNEENELSCVLDEFFPIMGKIDYMTTKEGKADNYVLCWFDDNEDDFGKAFRRLTGVTISKEIKCETDSKGKITCNGSFKAKHGKLA
ncbi:MAG: hypothetical protein CW716_04770 [Candidatus Bathyarchaeum sp.]|nr:MAG: hypothetical protein CW716_04770 [Candidatus Bathyarchaeum sp.]